MDRTSLSAQCPVPSAEPCPAPPAPSAEPVPGTRGHASFPIMPDLAIQLTTPAGPALLALTQYDQQRSLVQAAATRMGGLPLNVVDYVKEFGLIDDQHPFGRQVWTGLINLFSQYRYSYRVHDGRWMMGWFQAPHNFSTRAAMTPVDPLRDTIFYPACFFIFGDGSEVVMACEAILLLGSKPWWVHPSRVRNFREVTMHELPQAMRLLAVRNSWVAGASGNVSETYNQGTGITHQANSHTHQSNGHANQGNGHTTQGNNQWHWM